MNEIAGGDERFRVKIDGPEGAPVILMSNSLGCDLTMWDDVIPALAQDYRVIRYDTRGHGGSVVVSRPTSIAELADDALAILDDLGVARAHFVGLSMGGMIGQWLLRFAPERLDKVVLCNTAAMMGPPDLWNARIRAARAGMAALTPSVMERWFTPRFRKSQPEAVARVAAMVDATPPEGYASCCAAIRDMDQRWGLRSIVGDVTVLVGAHDPGATPAQGKAIADAIPGARLVTLDAAHLSAVERPQEFAAAILAALAAPPRKTRRSTPSKAAPAQRSPRVASRSRPLGRRAAAGGPKAPPRAPDAAKKSATSKAVRSAAAKSAPPKAAPEKTSSKIARPGASAKTVGKSKRPAKAAKAPAAPKTVKAPKPGGRAKAAPPRPRGRK